MTGYKVSVQPRWRLINSRACTLNRLCPILNLEISPFFTLPSEVVSNIRFRAGWQSPERIEWTIEMTWRVLLDSRDSSWRVCSKGAACASRGTAHTTRDAILCIVSSFSSWQADAEENIALEYSRWTCQTDMMIYSDAEYKWLSTSFSEF